MALTTEVLIFEASKDFSENLDIITPALDMVLKVDGAHSPIYYGKQVEDEGTGYAFLNWDSYEAHKAMMESPLYKDIIDRLTPSLGGKTEMLHVQFSAPTVGLEEPVTGILILKLKAPENRAAVVEILSGIAKASDDMIVYGRTREDEDKYVLIGGWPTIEAHWETAARPDLAAALVKLDALVDKDHHYHTKLLQYSL